jgi:hypothetical protein
VRIYTNRRSCLTGLALLLAAQLASAQQLSFTPFHANGTYDIGERVGWTVAPPPDATGPIDNYTCVIRKNNLDTIKTGTLDLAQGAATIETTVGEPAMLYVEVNPGAIHLGAAVAPSQLKPSIQSGQLP